MPNISGDDFINDGAGNVRNPNFVSADVLNEITKLRDKAYLADELLEALKELLEFTEKITKGTLAGKPIRVKSQKLIDKATK